MAADATKTLAWLDRVTNQSDISSSPVRIEGVKQRFPYWSDVEKLMLPRPLLSLDDPFSDDRAEEMTKSITELYVDDAVDIGHPYSRLAAEDLPPPVASPPSLHTKFSPRSATSDPIDDNVKVLQPIGTGRPGHKKTDSASSIATTSTSRALSPRASDNEVPSSLRRFFNHIMWLTQDSSTEVGVESCILVTNDDDKVKVAKMFGIRVKQLQQMKDFMDKEAGKLSLSPQPSTAGAEDKSQGTPPKSPGQKPLVASDAGVNGASADDDDEVILVRPKSVPKSPQSASTPPSRPQLMDPNSFGRAPATNGRGGHGHRGRGVYGGPRGGIPSTPLRSAERPPSRGAIYSPRRGNHGLQQQTQQHQSATQQQQQPPAAPLDLTKPIDPNAFTRATAGPSSTRGRRRLWEPS
jgi:hypothetical protein